MARAFQDAGTHKVAVFRKESILQKVSPEFSVCLRGIIPSSPSLYVLGRIESEASVIVCPTLTRCSESLDRHVLSNPPPLRSNDEPKRKVHHTRLCHRGVRENAESQSAPLTRSGGVSGPMAVQKMKTGDAAAIRCARVGMDTKAASLDTVPRREVTPFFEKVEAFL